MIWKLCHQHYLKMLGEGIKKQQKKQTNKQQAIFKINLIAHKRKTIWAEVNHIAKHPSKKISTCFSNHPENLKCILIVG